MNSLFLEPHVHCLRPHLLWTVSTTTVCEARALEETRVEQPGLSQDWALLIGLNRVPYGQESSRAVLEITIPFEERIRGQNIEGVLSGASHLTEVTSLLWLPSLTGNAGRHKPSLNRALSANLETTAAWVSCRDLAERKT